jgi:hypothetical protein
MHWRLNESGQVAFNGAGFGGSDSALYGPGPGGALTALAVKDAPAPGGDPGQLYSQFGQFEAVATSGAPALSNTGQVYIYNLFKGPGVTTANAPAVWGTDTAGVMHLVARQQSPLPGGSGEVIASIGQYTTDDTGNVAISLGLAIGSGGVTAANDLGIWQTDAAGNLTPLVREGDAAAGAPPGTTFTSFFSHQRGDTGMAFNAGLSSGGTGIFGPDGAGGYEAVALSGGVAPGTGGAVFGNVGTVPIHVDDAGGVAFHATLAVGGAVTSANDTGIWGPDGAGGTALVAREGSQAPGAPAGALFGSLSHVELNRLALSKTGDMAFRAGLLPGVGGVTSANDTGIWRADEGGDVILLAREGGTAAGLPAGAIFADFSVSRVPVINAQKDVAFAGGLQVGAGGVTSANDRVLFLSDAQGNLTILLREGDTITGPNGESIVLGDFALEPGGLNDSRQLLLNSNGYLLLVTIPEPGSALLLALGLGALASGATRREAPRPRRQRAA